MKIKDVKIGLRVFNRGDMANIEHFGTISKIKSSTWGDDVQIVPDKDSCDRSSYWIPAAMIHETDSGNGLTRFVTEAAYNAYRAKKIAELKEFALKAINKSRTRAHKLL